MTTSTLPERIADRLRRDVLRGKLRPGAPIKERDSAAELGVSRTPMREAIRILAKEGLVTLRPARSPIVAQPSLQEAIDAIEVLAALEVLSGELACRNATDRQLQEVETANRKFVDSHGQADVVESFEFDMAFHRAIATASNNAALIETHGTYLRRLWRIRFLSASRPESRARVLRQHGEIVAGLGRRDAEATDRAIRAHLLSLADNVRMRFAEDAAEAAS